MSKIDKFYTASRKNFTIFGIKKLISAVANLLDVDGVKIESDSMDYIIGEKDCITINIFKNTGDERKKEPYVVKVLIDHPSPLFFNVAFTVKFSDSFMLILSCENPKFRFPSFVKRFLRRGFIGSYYISK